MAEEEQRLQEPTGEPVRASPGVPSARLLQPPVPLLQEEPPVPLRERVLARVPVLGPAAWLQTGPVRVRLRASASICNLPMPSLGIEHHLVRISISS